MYISVYLSHGCVLTAGGTEPDKVAPASSVKPAPPRLHLTLNHLIFHKVLGKGSFGKVGGLSHISQAFSGASGVLLVQNFFKICWHVILYLFLIERKNQGVGAFAVYY